MSNKAVNINTITSNTLTASTLSQVAYMSEEQLAAYTPLAGFRRLPVDLEKTSAGFSAITFVNKETGQVVIAYRGSDNMSEVSMAAHSASTGTWDPQFTDATNYARVIGVRFQLNPPTVTTSAVSVDELFFALKNRAKKSIRTKPRGRFIPKSHAAYAGTRHRGPHHPSLQGANLP